MTYGHVDDHHDGNDWDDHQSPTGVLFCGGNQSHVVP